MNRLALFMKIPRNKFHDTGKYGFTLCPGRMKLMEKNLAIEIKTGFPTARV